MLITADLPRLSCQGTIRTKSFSPMTACQEIRLRISQKGSSDRLLARPLGAGLLLHAVGKYQKANHLSLRVASIWLRFTESKGLF
jgi:hypothetical protein